MIQIEGTTNVRICANDYATGLNTYYNSVSYVGVPATYNVDIDATIDIFSNVNSGATSLNMQWHDIVPYGPYNPNSVTNNATIDIDTVTISTITRDPSVTG